MTGVEAEAFYLGVNVVIWGYPAVKFEELMRGRTSPEILKKGNPQAAVNQLGLVRDLRGPEFKQIATPNNDTLYAQAFCDVSREPLVLSVPAVDKDRYYCMQLWDPNGDTFGYVGSRATGRGAGSYALVGPEWKGKLPDGVPAARAIQDGLRAVPLSLYGKSDQQTPPDLEFSAKRVAIDYPKDLPDGLKFYWELARSLRFTPPKPHDVVVAATLAEIGFKDGNTTFDYSSLSAAQISGLTKAVEFAKHVMDVNAQTIGESVNGWRWSPKSGVMGTDYLFRAAFAKWYTGGNAPQEAIYMDGREDNKGDPFDGSKKYTMHFAKGEQPPVAGFWSLSMYNLSDGSFVANDARRYSIGDRTPGLVTNDDGSLDLFIQHTAPDDVGQRANWLPSPSGGFYLDLRLYVPDDSLQNATWAPPTVTVVN